MTLTTINKRIQARATENASMRQHYLFQLSTPNSTSLSPLLPLPLNAICQVAWLTFVSQALTTPSTRTFTTRPFQPILPRQVDPRPTSRPYEAHPYLLSPHLPHRSSIAPTLASVASSPTTTSKTAGPRPVLSVWWLWQHGPQL